MKKEKEVGKRGLILFVVLLLSTIFVGVFLFSSMDTPVPPDDFNLESDGLTFGFCLFVPASIFTILIVSLRFSGSDVDEEPNVKSSVRRR